MRGSRRRNEYMGWEARHHRSLSLASINQDCGVLNIAPPTSSGDSAPINNPHLAPTTSSSLHSTATLDAGHVHLCPGRCSDWCSIPAPQRNCPCTINEAAPIRLPPARIRARYDKLTARHGADIYHPHRGDRPGGYRARSYYHHHRRQRPGCGERRCGGCPEWHDDDAAGATSCSARGRAVEQTEGQRWTAGLCVPVLYHCGHE